MVLCCVLSCRERFIRRGHITFHSFPKDEEKKKLWQLQIRREHFKPTRYSKVCSKHFTEDCFDRPKSGVSWLKPDAVPTIFDFPNQLGSKKCTCKSSKDRILEDNHHLQPSSQNKPGFASRSRATCKNPNCMANKGHAKIDKRRSYVGDFCEEDMLSPSKALKVFSIAKEQSKLQKNKIRMLTKKKIRLLNCVSSLQVMCQLKNSHNENSTSSILKENKLTNSEEKIPAMTVSTLKPVVIYVKACSESDDKPSTSPSIDTTSPSTDSMMPAVPEHSYAVAKNPFEFRKQLRIILEKKCFHKNNVIYLGENVKDVQKVK